MRKSTKNLILLAFLLTSQVLLFSSFGKSVKGDEYYRFDPEKTFEYNESNDLLYNDSFNTHNIDRMSVKHPRSSNFDFTDNKSIEVEEGLQDYTYDFNYNMLDGYHLAPYFDHYNLSIGDTETDMNFPTSTTVSSDCSVSVVDGDSFDGGKFKHVVEFDDRNSVGRVFMYKEFDDTETDDFYEWYWGKNSTAADENFDVSFYEKIGGTSYTLVRLSLIGNDLHDLTGEIYSDFLSVDTLYHMKIEFDDSENTYNLWVNQDLAVSDRAYDNTNSEDGVNRVAFYTPTTEEVKGYVSSFAPIKRTSWYLEDMNINEHMLTKFLDSDMNPEFENLAYGNNIDTIPVGAQEYNATYTFESDIDNTNTDIEFIDGMESSEPEAIVIDELDGHESVLRVKDDSSTTLQRVYNNIDQSEGIIELYVYKVDTETTVLHSDYDTPYEGGFSFRLKNNEIQYWDDPNWVQVGSYNTDEWTHLKVSFDCSTNTYDLYKDNKLVSESLPFVEDMDSLSYFTITQAGDGISYVDAIDYSWDSGYYEGRNLDYSESRLLLNDTSTDVSYGNIKFADTFSENRNNGSFSFDFEVSTLTSFYFYIRAEESLMGIILRFKNGNIEIYNGAGWDTLISGAYSINTEHEITIYWDCDEGFWVVIDDSLYGSFDFYGSPTYLSILSIQTVSGDVMEVYLDKFGYSWENYGIAETDDYKIYNPIGTKIFNIPEYDNHLDCLGIFDFKETEYSYFQYKFNSFTPTVNGTPIEFFLSTNTYKTSEILVRDGTMNVIRLRFNENDLEWYYGSTDEWVTLVSDINVGNDSLTHFSIVPFSYYFNLYITDTLTNETDSYTGNTFSNAWQSGIDNVRFETNLSVSNYSIILDAFSIDGYNYSTSENLYSGDYKYEIDKWDFRLNTDTKRVWDDLTNYYYPWDALDIDARRDLAVSIQGWRPSGSANQKETYSRFSDAEETYLQFKVDHNTGETFYFDKSVNYLSNEEIKLETEFDINYVNESYRARYGQYLQFGSKMEGIYLLVSNSSSDNTTVVYRSGSSLYEMDEFSGNLDEYRLKLTTFYYPVNNSGLYVLKADNLTLSANRFTMYNDFSSVNKIRIHTSHSQQGHTNLYSVGFYADNPYNDYFSSYAKQAVGGLTLDYVLNQGTVENFYKYGSYNIYRYTKPEQINVVLDNYWAIELGFTPSFNLESSPTSQNVGYSGGKTGDISYHDYDLKRHIYPLYHDKDDYFGSKSLLFMSELNIDTTPKELKVDYISTETLRVKFESEIDDTEKYYYPTVEHEGIFTTRGVNYDAYFYGYLYWIDGSNRLQFTHNTRTGIPSDFDNFTEGEITDYTTFSVDIDKRTFADVSAVIPGKMYSYNDSDYIGWKGVNTSVYYDYEKNHNMVYYNGTSFNAGFTLGNGSFEGYSLDYEYKEYGDNLTQGAYADEITIFSEQRLSENYTFLQCRKGYIDYIKLQDPIWLDVNLVKIDGFLAVLPVLIILVIPTFLIYKKFSKAIIIPIMFMIMTIICFATNLIALWLFFIIMCGLFFFIFVIGRYGDDLF